MDAVYVVNPLTKRKIMVGSHLYRKLVLKKVIVPEENRLKEIMDEIAKTRRPLKPCAEGQVRNPETNHCISKKGPVYKRLLKKGVVFHDEDIVPAPAIVPAPVVHAAHATRAAAVVKSKNRDKCKNDATFLFQTDIDEVDKSDLLILPSGFCFSIEEIVEWLKSDAFNNIDPYVEGAKLFHDDNKAVWEKHPKIAEGISAYFKKEQAKRKDVYALIKDHMDVLYLIGETGRICYFDQLMSHEAENSAHFEYSIAAISKLQEAIQALPRDVQTAVQQLKNVQMTLDEILRQANQGGMCIHGVGWSLIKIFVQTFMNMEKAYKLKYEPNKCGLYFIEEKKGMVVLYSQEIRFVANTASPYYARFREFLNTLSDSKSSLVWKKTKIKKSGLATVYEKECPNEAFLSSLNSDDEWFEVPEWRKIRTEDGYCFDLLFLIKSITSQLNTAKNVNPYPMYPTNVFTNKPLGMRDLIQIRRRIGNNYLTVAPSLLMFLHNPEKLWSNDADHVKSAQWQEECIKLFEKDLRFRRYLYNNVDDIVIHGAWVYKTVSVSPDERAILRYLETANPVYVRGMKPIEVPNNYYFVDNLSTTASQVHAYPDAKEIKRTLRAHAF